MTNEIEFSLIIPTLNEAENIGSLLQSISAVLSQVRHEIVVVDDNSSDGTADIVRRAAEKSSFPIVLVSRAQKNGLSAAVIEGFNKARGSILGVMDADFSHDINLLPALIQSVRDGRQMAVGSRRVEGGGADHWPWYRRLLSDVATRIGRLWINIKIKDPMSGYFVLDRRLFEKIKDRLNPKGYKILLEVYVRGRVTDFVEIPFVFKDRRQGHSKLTGSVAMQYLSMLWDLKAYSILMRQK